MANAWCHLFLITSWHSVFSISQQQVHAKAFQAAAKRLLQCSVQSGANGACSWQSFRMLLAHGWFSLNLTNPSKVSLKQLSMRVGRMLIRVNATLGQSSTCKQEASARALIELSGMLTALV